MKKKGRVWIADKYKCDKCGIVDTKTLNYFDQDRFCWHCVTKMFREHSGRVELVEAAHWEDGKPSK